MGKVRCPLWAPSMALSNSRPEIYEVPEHPPRCCTQHSVTVPPEVNAKTRQRHDYPSAAHRRSYGRRSGAERANSRLKDPAGINVSARGWCKQMGLVPFSLFLACACVVVNFDLVDSFEAQQADQARRGGTEYHDRAVVDGAPWLTSPLRRSLRHKPTRFRREFSNAVVAHTLRAGAGRLQP